MSLLKDSQIDWIEADLARRGLLYEPLREEIVDHFCEAIEAHMEQGISFMDAYTHELAAFGPHHLANLDHQTLKAVGTLPMFRNYLLITGRNLRRNPRHTVINLLGLTAGLISCLLIGLYVIDEWTYDRHHANAERIVRISTRIKTPESDLHAAQALAMVGPKLATQYADVEASVRLLPYPGKLTIQYRQKQFAESNVHFTDPSVFNIFTYPFMLGDPKTALLSDESIVLSASMAGRYFGSDWPEQNPIGKQVLLNGKPYQVTGIMADSPHQTDRYVDAFIPGNDEVFDDWVFTYLLLKNRDASSTLTAQLPAFATEHLQPMFGQEASRSSIVLGLDVLTDLHFLPGLLYDTPKGNLTYVYLLIVAAVLILVIAGINYVNLTIAQATSRFKEVGVRKVMGAARRQLVGQYIGEAALVSVAALLLAVGGAAVLLPVFNQFTGKLLTLDALGQESMWLLAAGMVVTLATLGGAYIAFYLSGLSPVAILSGNQAKPVRAGLQLGLVAVQFTVSIALISCTLVVYRQMQYVSQYELGFRRQQILVLDFPGESLPKTLTQTFQQQLSAQADVERVALGSWGSQPGTDASKDVFYLPGNGQDNMRTFTNLSVDEHYLPVLGLKLIAGRNFDARLTTDAQKAFIVNKALVKAMGWREPRQALGQRLKTASGERDGVIVGVVDDFHLTSLHNLVEPVVLMRGSDEVAHVFVALTGNQMAQRLAKIEDLWHGLVPNQTLSYHFLDQAFDAQYRHEQRLLHVFGYFTGLAILIAALGLLGVVAFVSQHRAKELSIRKVMGARESTLVWLLVKPFLGLVVLSLLIACPLTWLLMSRWLTSFAYHVELGAGVFGLAGLLTLVLTVLTTAYYAIRTARRNPIQSLRYQ